MPRFSLETALSVRERLEKLYQKALAEQLKIEKQHREIINVMKDALENHNNDLDEAKKKGLTINQLLMGSDFQQRIKNNLEIKKDQLKEQLEVVELKRQELTKASQKKRVIEILKENEIKEFLAEKDRLERLEVDEIAQNYRRFSQNG
tara:strand:- start:226 stop:669 length:444 start_codon:yes stop_codon:yes gene_type:complete